VSGSSVPTRPFRPSDTLHAVIRDAANVQNTEKGKQTNRHHESAGRRYMHEKTAQACCWQPP